VLNLIGQRQSGLTLAVDHPLIARACVLVYTAAARSSCALLFKCNQVVEIKIRNPLSMKRFIPA
jgi:hypothetical protein